MFVLGLVLLVLVAALAVGIVVNGTDPATFEGLGISLDTTVATVFITGMLVGLALLLSLALMLAGTKRSVNRRREVRTLRREAVATSEVDAERRRLEAERERLSTERTQLDESRDAPVAPPPAGDRDGGATHGSGRHSGDTTATTERPERPEPR